MHDLFKTCTIRKTVDKFSQAPLMTALAISHIIHRIYYNNAVSRLKSFGLKVIPRLQSTE